MTPRAIERLSGEAGGSYPLVGRWGWRAAEAGPGIDDERAVGARGCLDGLLEQAVEEHAAGAGSPAVEAEGELVQVCLQVPGLDAALVGASSQRSTSDATRCTPGSSSWACDPDAATGSGWWVYSSPQADG